MLPKEYVSSSTSHRRFEEWRESGIFYTLWTILLQKYDKKIGIKWNWQSLDSISVKSSLGGAMTGHNPTDRGKLGTKSILLQIKMAFPCLLL
jgi:transposase